MAKLGTVDLTHPLNNAVVTIRVTRRFRLRLWLAVQLVHLATWIGGGQFELEESD